MPDALLADLESTTSHISKRPVFLSEETPYSFPSGCNTYHEISVPAAPASEALNGNVPDSLDSWSSSSNKYIQKQNPLYGSAAPKENVVSPIAHVAEEEHVYSFPNKQRSAEPSPTVMSSSLGSNLSELDRLLLELNAVQQAPSSSLSADDLSYSFSAPVVHAPLSNVSDSSVSAVSKVIQSSKEKPKRNGARGIEDVRPSVESLLDELESSVPSPVPSITVPQGEISTPQRVTSNQQQTRISASSATRELDELMASLSDFKTCHTFSELSYEPSTTSSHPSSLSTYPSASPSCAMSCSFTSPVLLRIDEDEIPISFSQHENGPRSRKEVFGFACTDKKQPTVTASALNPVKDVCFSVFGKEPGGSLVCNQMDQTAKSERGKDECIVPQCDFNSAVCDESSNVLRSGDQKMSNYFPCSMPELHSDLNRDKVHVLRNPPLGKASLEKEGYMNASNGHYTELSSKSDDQISTTVTQDSEQVLLPEISARERISASRQMKSVIKRTKETPNVHPMSRDLSPRRRFGPAIYNKSPSQDRLIEELHDRFGIDKQETYKSPDENWLTEGVIITSRPSKNIRLAEQQIEKIIIPPDSPQLARKVFSVTASPPSTIERTKFVSSKATSPALPSPVLPPPAPPLPHPLHPPLNTSTFNSFSPQSLPPCKGFSDDYQDLSKPFPICQEDILPPCQENHITSSARMLPFSPIRSLPLPKTCVSIGCQTDDNPLFPPIQMISPLTSRSSPVFAARPPPNPYFTDKAVGSINTAPSWHLPESKDLMSDSETPADSAKYMAASNERPPVHEDIVSITGFMAQGKSVSNSPPTGAPKPGSQLDNMLGSLQSDLNKLGVATVAKGVCGACKKPIAGQVVTAMGKTWHPEHFVCTHCQEEIGSRNFFERDGQPYCEKDYHNLFSPRCYYCNGPILDKVVTALDRTWHPEHFFCAQCGAFFGPEGFHERDGKAYCRKDYFDMFAPKCGGCTQAILENYISALNTLWHPECFVCRECFTPFINGSFFEHDGQPYCEVHYHERRGSLCSGCQKPITGRCITAMGKKFHPEHFVCAFCLKQLNKGTFKEQNDKPYCQNCFVKLFC
ncbi:paxillin isoform X2 [Bombina bombina]|uniref:paxillin isoform X2 n=1 Tax=Bombina bombina TaxID=8345 RepID=UPI00235A7968|nr:paxillin isoform X2 [Bombina bombina]